MRRGGTFLRGLFFLLMAATGVGKLADMAAAVLDIAHRQGYPPAREPEIRSRRTVAGIVSPVDVAVIA
ncbi:MAG: hypothetical protein ACREXT_12205 [Gammaproteobacteria bacterium]